ncbi:uncharacterized protein SCHCODRAFT_02618358 [Schizophyllum commune H4-8]|uniref:uncharacterized protein n=1 Tax=Schizophyllum commune (strain H4-8 / FGSC 9210) TaxID=578458 RepID=UPI0021600BC5|nr:uncharacterized protein SCHCODRAFT_02618358 [Schizophyllum commune H4-8]KAI5895013.1 hypothetical protein SCHCODRAFT_02618358 [Schizophyllum commune H4-8]
MRLSPGARSSSAAGQAPKPAQRPCTPKKRPSAKSQAQRGSGKAEQGNPLLDSYKGSGPGSARLRQAPKMVSSTTIVLICLLANLWLTVLADALLPASCC